MPDREELVRVGVAGHGVYLEEDEEGWSVATCVCGWTGPPVPDVETAADAFGDHRVEALQAAGCRIVGPGEGSRERWCTTHRCTGAGATIEGCAYSYWQDVEGCEWQWVLLIPIDEEG